MRRLMFNITGLNFCQVSIASILFNKGRIH